MKRVVTNFVVATLVCAATVQAAITIDLVNPAAGSGPWTEGATVGFDGWWQRTQDSDPLPDAVHAGFYDAVKLAWKSYGSVGLDDFAKNKQHNWATNVTATPKGTWQMRAELVKYGILPGAPQTVLATDNNGNATINEE